MGLKKETISDFLKQYQLCNNGLILTLEFLLKQEPGSQEGKDQVSFHLPYLLKYPCGLIEKAGRLVAELGTCECVFGPPTSDSEIG